MKKNLKKLKFRVNIYWYLRLYFRLTSQFPQDEDVHWRRSRSFTGAWQTNQPERTDWNLEFFGCGKHTEGVPPYLFAAEHRKLDFCAMLIFWTPWPNSIRIVQKELSWIFRLTMKFRETVRLCREKTDITSSLASLSLTENSVFNLVDNELRFNVLRHCMIKREIRMKILTVWKQLGNLKWIFEVDTYFELKCTTEFQKSTSEF